MGLFDIFGTGDQQAAANDQIAGLKEANTQGQNYLTSGLNNLNTSYAAGLAPLTQNFNSATAGANAYGDATGANGAAGNARATANFQANPGYQFTLNQGTQNVDRNQAAQGMLASGNTDKAIADYTTGLANQNYQQYTQNLQPYLGQQTQTGGQIAATDASLGQQQNANQTQAASMAYGTQTGIGNANANKDLAGLNASANGINALQNGLGGAAQLFGFL